LPGKQVKREKVIKVSKEAGIVDRAKKYLAGL